MEIQSHTPPLIRENSQELLQRLKQAILAASVTASDLVDALEEEGQEEIDAIKVLVIPEILSGIALNLIETEKNIHPDRD